ncbi:MAG: ATP-dependent DNA helicase [Acidobacteria bacterium]|nr:ATP-dependent DNA helicase [Acidobacteriota bacterium]
MQSFDPDDDAPDREVDAESGVQIDDDLVEIDVDRALALLDRITARLPGGGESRDGQRQMVAAVASAFSRREHAIIEAGTGVGKSLAYLVPAAMSGHRVVVATATKNLQDQLAQKDAPTVAALATRTRVAVLKGKNNYLCRNRALATGGGTQLSFDDGSSVPQGVADQMRRVLAWADETETGDRDELPFELDARAWRGLSVTPQECLGRAQCPQGHNCFHELAKDRAADSSIVIVNTHLYAAHLASGAMLLPAHDFVVFDEAHEVLDIFAALLGTSLNAARLRAFASVAKPLVGPSLADVATNLIASADRLATILEIQYDAQELAGLGPDAQRELETAAGLTTRLVESLRALETAGAEDEARKIRTLGPGVHLASDLARVANPQKGEILYLSRRDREVELEVNLVDVGPRLREELWGQVTAVLTSATIPDSLPAQLGLEDVRIETFASPFDYAHHSLLYVPAGFPGRNESGAEAAIIDELVTLIDAAGGRTLALFTNRAVMNRVAEAVAARIDTPVLVQGTLSRQRIIEKFRDSAEASLFAVTSFWQGIDVAGHSLSLVTIDRLPFSVPNDPLLKARQERSANPFFDVDLPRATMLLAQGVGRLIRNRSDRGVVAVLDTRLAEARYRSLLFKKLPPMKRTRDRREVTSFLEELRR